MLKCVIVDDEQFSVDAILKYINLIPNLDVIGIYTESPALDEKMGIGHGEAICVIHQHAEGLRRRAEVREIDGVVIALGNRGRLIAGAGNGLVADEL